MAILSKTLLGAIICSTSLATSDNNDDTGTPVTGLVGGTPAFDSYVTESCNDGDVSFSK